MGYQDNPFWQAWRDSGFDPNFTGPGGPGRYTVPGGSQGSRGPVANPSTVGPGEFAPSVRPPSFTPGQGFGGGGFGSALNLLLGRGGGMDGFDPTGGMELGADLPTRTGGFSDALERAMGPDIEDMRGGGTSDGSEGGRGGGFGTWEKILIAANAAGGLADIYGAYQEGRARDREYRMREEQQQRRQELAAALEPYLREILAQGPPRPVTDARG